MRWGKSSGKVPASGRNPQNPQSAPNSIASIRTSSMSPGSAPATAIGPVRMCGPRRGGAAAWIAANGAGTARPRSGAGMTSGPPETHSTVTVSPDRMLRIGANAASNAPQRVVAGVAWMCCITPLCATEPEVSKPELRYPLAPAARVKGR